VLFLRPRPVQLAHEASYLTVLLLVLRDPKKEAVLGGSGSPGSKKGSARGPARKD
jgi:hypothetical protein